MYSTVQYIHNFDCDVLLIFDILRFDSQVTHSIQCYLPSVPYLRGKQHTIVNVRVNVLAFYTEKAERSWSMGRAQCIILHAQADRNSRTCSAIDDFRLFL